MSEPTSSLAATSYVFLRYVYENLPTDVIVAVKRASSDFREAIDQSQRRLVPLLSDAFFADPVATLQACMESDMAGRSLAVRMRATGWAFDLGTDCWKVASILFAPSEVPDWLGSLCGDDHQPLPAYATVLGRLRLGRPLQDVFEEVSVAGDASENACVWTYAAAFRQLELLEFMRSQYDESQNGPVRLEVEESKIKLDETRTLNIFRFLSGLGAHFSVSVQGINNLLFFAARMKLSRTDLSPDFAVICVECIKTFFTSRAVVAAKSGTLVTRVLLNCLLDKGFQVELPLALPLLLDKTVRVCVSKMMSVACDLVKGHGVTALLTVADAVWSAMNLLLARCPTELGVMLADPVLFGSIPVGIDPLYFRVCGVLYSALSLEPNSLIVFEALLQQKLVSSASCMVVPFFGTVTLSACADNMKSIRAASTALFTRTCSGFTVCSEGLGRNIICMSLTDEESFRHILPSFESVQGCASLMHDAILHCALFVCQGPIVSGVLCRRVVQLVQAFMVKRKRQDCVDPPSSSRNMLVSWEDALHAWTEDDFRRAVFHLMYILFEQKADVKLVRRLLSCSMNGLLFSFVLRTDVLVSMVTLVPYLASDNFFTRCLFALYGSNSVTASPGQWMHILRRVSALPDDAGVVERLCQTLSVAVATQPTELCYELLCDVSTSAERQLRWLKCVFIDSVLFSPTCNHDVLRVRLDGAYACALLATQTGFFSQLLRASDGVYENWKESICAIESNFNLMHDLRGRSTFICKYMSIQQRHASFLVSVYM